MIYLCAFESGCISSCGGTQCWGKQDRKKRCGRVTSASCRSPSLSLSLALSRSLSSPLKHLSGQVIAKLRRCGEQKGRQKLSCVMLISWGRMFMGMFKGMIMPYVACNSLGRKVPNLNLNPRPPHTPALNSVNPTLDPEPLAKP